MADNGHQIAMAARLRSEKRKAALGVVKGVAGKRAIRSGLDFIRVAGSSVLSLGATSVVRRGVSAR